MYSKLTFFLAALTILVNNFVLSAQGLNEKNIYVTYYAYPSHPLAAQSYSVNLQGSLASDGFFKLLVNREVKLNGLTNVDAPGKGDVVLTIETPDIKIDSVGAITGSGDEHYFLVKYTFPVKVSVTDDKGITFSEQFYPHPILAKSEYSSDPNTLQLLYRYGNSLRDFCLRNTILMLSKELNAKFGSLKINASFFLFSAKGKKLNYDELNEALKTAKNVFKDDVKKTLDPALLSQLNAAAQVWKNEVANADTINTTARINAEVYYGLHYNLAFASLWALNFGEAKDHLAVAKRLKKNDFYYFDYGKNIQALETFLANYEKLYLINTKK